MLDLTWESQGLLNASGIPQEGTELLAEGDQSLGQAAGTLSLRPRCLHTVQPMPPHSILKPCDSYSIC